MSESNWGETEAPRPKKRVPTWMWACGGGCLIALILGIAGGTFLFVQGKKMIEEGTNPEVQWKKLAETLPYDERPQDVKLILGWHLGADVYAFTDDHGHQINLIHFPEFDEQKRSEFLNPKETNGFMGQGKRLNVTPATVHVQGRDLKGVRFDQMDAEEKQEAAGMPKAGKGPAISLDLTSENDSGALFIQMTRVNGTDPIKDEEVLHFLKPFHVGPDR
jgi:hypothetical protein